MSFDAFLQCFKDGELDGFSPKILEDAFENEYKKQGDDKLVLRVEYPVIVDESAPKTIMHEGKEYPLVYGDDSTLYISNDANGNIDHITINRPASHERFYNSLYSILKQSNTVIYSIGDHPPLVGKLDTLYHLPQGLIETKGNPILVSYPLQIREQFGC